MENKIKQVKPKQKRTGTVKLHGDKVIWLSVFLLALISIIAVYSSSTAAAFRESRPQYHYLFEQMKFVIMGFVALFVCYLIPLGWYRKLSFAALAFSALLLVLTYATPLGKEINGAKRWIEIAGVQFQSSEFAKIAIILYLARILEISTFKTFWEYALKILLPVGSVCLLAIAGSFSVFAIMATITFIILICYKIKWSYLWWTLLIVVGVLVLMFSINAIFEPKGFPFDRVDTAEKRIERFFNPQDEELTAADKNKQYQKEKAIEAIQLGRGRGMGAGNGIIRDNLPHSDSDFIYASIIEEWGIAGAIVVLILYMWFFNRSIFIAKNCKKMYSTIVVLGLSTLITMQALLHILVNVGIFPITGQTLPLVSSGGTSFVIMSCAFGIILSVNRTIEISVAKEALNGKNN